MKYLERHLSNAQVYLLFRRCCFSSRVLYNQKINKCSVYFRFFRANTSPTSGKLAYEQALRGGALAAGQEKEGELATKSLKFEYHLQFSCGFPSTDLSDFRQSAPSRNKRECKENIEKYVPRLMTSLLR